nr:MAG TPA: hypothetical protein [Herelleviridae sp.]
MEQEMNELSGSKCVCASRKYQLFMEPQGFF